MKSVGTRFLIPLGILAVLGSVFVFYQTYESSRKHAYELINQQAEMALEFNLAIRGYAGENIRPLMEKLVDKDTFIPETMSTSFISRKIFEEVEKKFPDYIIRFSSDNPRNPINRATSDEQRMIEYFRQNPQVSRRTEEIQIEGKRYLAHFSPRFLKNECLQCHGDPKDAPAELIKRYGPTAGFHRKLGDVAGLDIVAVPVEAINATLASEMRSRSMILAAVFLLLFGSIIYIFRFVVGKRLVAMAIHFNEIAAHPESPWMTSIEVKGNDEISVVGIAFNKLVEQLRAAHASLEQRVSKRTEELRHANAQLQLELTERKQVEEELRNTRDYLENIFANSADSIGIVDRHGKFTRWNIAAEEIFGHTYEDIKGKTAFDLYADPGELDVMLKQLRQHGFIRNYQINIKKKDGSIFPGSLSIRVLRNSNNEVIGSITVCRDLTETKQMMMRLQNEIHQHEQSRQALLESEKNLMNIIDFLPDATFVIDTNGKVIAWNKALEEMTGVKGQDIVGKDNYEYALPFYGERRPILIDLVLEPDKGIEKYIEVKREDKALVAVGHFHNFRGKATYLFGKASPLIDLHGDIIGSIESIRDITALRQAEIDRLQVSKLESIGTLAGGIAHDFNNILTAILGNIGLAMLNRKLGEEEIERLLQAERACLRAQELSVQLMTFAKGGAPIKKVISLATLVRESGKLALAGSKSRCEFSIPEDLWSVEADEGQISQVINNLLINADQAMPGGGIIKIEAGNIVVAEGTDLPMPEGKYVKLTITDQGIGIPSQYLDKIFDPYFTTKQKGSGLGLATAYSIIIKHSGYLKVGSQVGVGTTFHIYLPAQEEKAVAALEEQVTPSFGEGKVLVMDDDENIREILCRMLGRLGYEADSAIDGSQAIEKFVKEKESGRQFDVVILDLTVPGGMGGKETIENLLRIDPQVKAIVSSGYSDDPIMANFKNYGFSAVIAKPYKVVDLSKILQRVILK